MIEVAVFIASVLGTLVLGLLNPVATWWQSFVARGSLSAVIVLAFTVPFLGGRGGPDASDLLGTAGATRLIRLGVLLLLLFITLNGVLRNSRCLRHAGSAAIAMLLYAALAMFSATYSVSPLVSALKGFEVFVLVMTGIFLAGQLRTLPDIQWLLDVLALVMLFFVVSAFMGMVFLPGRAFAKMMLSSSIVVQGVVPVVNANSLTQFSALLALLTLVQLLVRGWRRSGPSVWVVFGIAVSMMLLSHSRTSIFAAAAALMALMYFSGRKAAAVVVAVAGSLAWVFTEVVASYIFRGQSEQVFSSLSGRTYFWEGVWDEFVQSPIIGHGFYAAQRVLLRTSTVDNTYLEVLLGLGIVGIIAFTVPILLTAFGLLRNIPRRRQLPAAMAIWLQLVAIFVLLFVRSLTGPSFQVMHPNLVMFMILAISIAALTRLTRVSARSRGREEAGDEDDERPESPPNTGRPAGGVPRPPGRPSRAVG